MRQTIRALLRELGSLYPPTLVPSEAEIARIAFNLSLVTQRKGTRITLLDIGGGVGLFSLGCAALGITTILMDDFGDPVNLEVGLDILDLHRSHGVRVIVRDPLEQGLGLPANSLDVITCFDSLEHWHRSPKPLLHCVMEVLKPGGLFVLATPNCVNLRKRLTVPLGTGKWSALADWYERETFRGHVREPDVDDLRYFARDMGLVSIELLGRNWAGYASPSGAVRLATLLTDPILRLRPSLCSNLYLLGSRPAH